MKPYQRAAQSKRRPRRRAVTELVKRELDAADRYDWYCLLCRSQKERQLEQALRFMGFQASFTALDVRYRRAARSKPDKTFERFNIATMPGYVFIAVPKQWRGLPWFMLAKARERAQPGGMSFLHGYVADHTTMRPSRFGAGVIKEMMARSHVPLYMDKEAEEAFDFDYGTAEAVEVIEPGDEVTVAAGFLKGEGFTVKRVSGPDVVVDAPTGEMKIPAKLVTRAA